jgi:hypothetical protein
VFEKFDERRSEKIFASERKGSLPTPMGKRLDAMYVLSFYYKYYTLL